MSFIWRILSRYHHRRAVSLRHAAVHRPIPLKRSLYLIKKSVRHAERAEKLFRKIKGVW